MQGLKLFQLNGRECRSQDLKVATVRLLETRLSGRPQSADHSNNKYRGWGRAGALGTEEVLNGGLLGMRG